MSMRMLGPTLGAAMLIACASPEAAAGDDQPGRVAVALTQTELRLQPPMTTTGGWTLTVSGEQRWFRLEFGPSETPTVGLTDDQGQPLPDGAYTWELRALHEARPQRDPNAEANGRDPDASGPQVPAGSAGAQTISGGFTIVDGAIVTPSEEGDEIVERSGDQDPGVSARATVDEDSYVLGSSCVGRDCVPGEPFDFDTLRLKENNLRIHFSDTSAPPMSNDDSHFPSNDWRLVANDLQNGGRNVFYLENATAGREVFSVDAAARSNAMYVSKSNVGFSTATPVRGVPLHTVFGDTPGIRLEQDNSSGWGRYTWDVAANEIGFLIRDVTNGNALPFRIRAGAPNSAFLIGPNGNIGLGRGRHSFGSSNEPLAAALHIKHPEPPTIQLENTENNSRWRVGLDTGGSFVINDIADPDVEEMRIAPGGQVLVHSTVAHPEHVFDPDYPLMALADLEQFVQENKHLPGVLSAEEAAGKVDLSSLPLQLLEKVQELTLHAIEQGKQLEETRAELLAVQEELSVIKAKIAQPLPIPR